MMNLNKIQKTTKPQQIPSATTEKDRPKTLLIILMMISLLLGGLQIYFTNTIAVHGEEIKAYEKELRQLQQATEKLERQIHQTASLAYIESKARNELKMVDIDHAVIYISPDYFAVRP